MSYDRYGNRTAQQTVSGCTGLTCPTNSVTVSASTNQITGSPYAYDANGNMTNDGQNTLVYDGENRLLSATNGSASGTYTHDGNNLRVKKVSGSTTTVYIFSGSKVIAEYDNGAAVGSPSREYIYSGSALLAKIDSTGTKYYHQDQLSNRVLTDSNGNLVAQQGHFPFGEQWYPAPPTAPPTKWLFTSYERDSESGNDYAMARYHVNRLARFSAPDLLPGSLSSPQSTNLYAYVLNDPTNLVDPSGLQQTKSSFPPLPPFSGFDPFSLIDIPVVSDLHWYYMNVSPSGIVNLTTGQTLAQMGWEQNIEGIFEIGTIVGWASDYIGTGLLYSGTVESPSASGGGTSQTPAEAATQYCRDNGHIFNFNIPFTNVPIILDATLTAGPIKYGSTNDIQTVIPLMPWSPLIGAGVGYTLKINPPKEPAPQLSFGIQNGLSGGTFILSDGTHQGSVFSFGLGVGPLYSLVLPTNNACGMMAKKKK